MKNSEFKKRSISTLFNKTMDDAPQFEGWTIQGVENCHTNGLSTYYTYLHNSGTVKIIVRQSDHFSRYENEQRGFVDHGLVFPALFQTKSFLIFDDLKWMEECTKEELVERFCK